MVGPLCVNMTIWMNLRDARARLTRRQFGAMALSAGLVAALPKVADAAETQGADVEIKTPDGVADAYFVHPGEGQTRRCTHLARYIRIASCF
jgi:hypothetical protein